MYRKVFAKIGLLAAACLVIALIGSFAQMTASPGQHTRTAAAPASSHGISVDALTVTELAHAQSLDSLAGPPANGWPTPSNRSFHLMASCQPYTSAILTGASAWRGLSQGGGTPVYCQNTWVSQCGSGKIIGCNFGQGQKIILYPGGTGQDALLAAHEFGHDWYGHSSYQCASWASPAHVMAPSLCGYGPLGNDQVR